MCFIGETVTHVSVLVGVWMVCCLGEGLWNELELREPHGQMLQSLAFELTSVDAYT